MSGNNYEGGSEHLAVLSQNNLLALIMLPDSTVVSLNLRLPSIDFLPPVFLIILEKYVNHWPLVTISLFAA